MHDLQPTARRLGALVEAVDDAHLDAPTPCPEYTVGDLLDHIARLTVAFIEAARKERGTNAAPPPTGSQANLVADWRTRIPADAAALADAWGQDGAWDGYTMIAGVEMPAGVVGTVGIDEVVTHAWDLARATGQPFDIDGESVTACMEFVGPMSEPGAEGRRAPAFGPVVTPPDGAAPLDRLIALTGRDPAWTSPG
jgi:uncharacterized protein (TIGR03086 family)